MYDFTFAKNIFSPKKKILNYTQKACLKFVFFFLNVKTILMPGIEITIQLGRRLKSVAIIFLTSKVILKLPEWKHKI